MLKRIVAVTGLLIIICAASQADTPYQYNHRGKRDPFIPLVGIASSSAGSIEDIMGIDDVDLQGTARDAAGKKLAIINGEMINEGETRGRLTIKKITEGSVRLAIGDIEYKLNIYEETTE